MIKKLIKLCETNFIPDSIIRFGIRQLLKKRLGSLVSHDVEFNNNKKMAFIDEMNSSSIALVPELANEQHYEVPSKFYDYCLGKHKKSETFKFRFFYVFPNKSSLILGNCK